MMIKIKGLNELPKNCDDCILLQTDGNQWCGVDENIKISNSVRPEKCPLEEGKWVSHKDRLIQIAKEANMTHEETSENAIKIDDFIFVFDYEGKLEWIESNE